MPKQTTPVQPLITELPLTAEAREAYIRQLFAEELPHHGELFVPTDTFYAAGGPRARAKTMKNSLCQWLGIKPGYVHLEFESGDTGTRREGTRYTIYIEDKLLADEFVLGAYLAYALTRYLLEDRKQILLPGTDSQAALMASASILFGLGIVITNGVHPRYSWFLASHFSPLHGFPAASYYQMNLSFIAQHHVLPAAFQHTLAPWAAHNLGYARAKQPSHAVRDTTRRIKVRNTKIIGLGWIILLVLFIGGFTWLQRVKPTSATEREAQQNMQLLQDQHRQCIQQLDYEKQYADMGDIQTVRSLNASDLHCQSLQNQYQAAADYYQQLVNQ